MQRDELGDPEVLAAIDAADDERARDVERAVLAPTPLPVDDDD